MTTLLVSGNGMKRMAAVTVKVGQSEHDQFDEGDY